MADSAPEIIAGWRLKKAEDGAVFGPVPENILREWAASAQIAPDDLIDAGDDTWQPAPKVEFLEMVWEVVLADGQAYGPTTWGALLEFVKEGLVTPQTHATHLTSREVRPVQPIRVTIDEPVPVTEEPGASATVISSKSGQIYLDVAKDQRIRQLEEDLRMLKKEHDELLQKYRVLNKETVELRTKAGKTSAY